jgi:ribonuclease P protein component
LKQIKLYGLSKDERLCSRKAIDKLFTSTKTVFHYPIRFVYQISEKIEGDPPIQILFTAPKKKFKRAVHRNLLKRRMREAYRLNKNILIDAINDKPLQIRVAFLYISSDISEYAKINDAIILALNDLQQLIEGQ